MHAGQSRALTWQGSEPDETNRVAELGGLREGWVAGDAERIFKPTSAPPTAWCDSDWYRQWEELAYSRLGQA